ncbi:hypothetical protein BDSB_05375 [Burkholderia dolosa PC543]|nr:hypothetical protein BDSB_05375 [Burkholderia dolosa PC543]
MPVEREGEASTVLLRMSFGVYRPIWMWEFERVDVESFDIT